MKEEIIQEIIRKGAKLGKEQKDLKYASTSHDLLKFLSPLSQKAEIGMISYNFPSSEWENKEWVDWLKKARIDLEANIKVVGGPKIDSFETISDLVKENIIELRLLSASVKSHIFYITNPPQLLLEEYHAGGEIIGFHFTSSPFKDAWEKLKEFFDSVWKSGKPVKNLEEIKNEVIEDINEVDLIGMYLLKKGKISEDVFFEELKKIVDKLQEKGIAKNIYFSFDPVSKYYNKEIVYKFEDLLNLGFIKTEKVEGKIYYSLSDSGKNIPQYAKKFSSWRILEKFSDVFSQ